MIPKRIFTIWIGEIPMPKEYEKWCNTHIMNGWERVVLLLDDAKHIAETNNIAYLKEAIEAKKWVKVSDYMRIWNLFAHGGIYLDCDMEVLKPLDDLLDTGLFVGRENDHVVANSIIGAEQFHPLLKKYLEIVNGNFKGGGDLIFEPAERLFTDLCLGLYGNFEDMITYSSDYFFPMNEITKEEKITKNTHVYHHFMRSWKK
jgi:hypothetical protein